MYGLLRPLLFGLDPERAHHLALGALRVAGELAPLRAALRAAYCARDERLATRAFGLDFTSPLGLAAGYDKDGVAVRGIAALGFGHVEVGTLTLRPQPGNPRPRVHRFPTERSLVNSMGFPNAGVDALRLPAPESLGGARVGVNVGKNKDTPLERAAEEYAELLRRVHGRADYVALNVSSPNTPALRELQHKRALLELLGEVARTRDGLAPRVPLLVGSPGTELEFAL